MGEGTPNGVIYPTCFFEQVCHLFYPRFILLSSLVYADYLVFIIHLYLLFMIIWILWQYYYFFVFIPYSIICNINNFCIRLSFHFTYDTDEETRDSEIYLSVILNHVMLMLLFHHIFKWIYLKTKFVWRIFVFFWYLVMSGNGEIHNAYNLYIIKNTLAIVHKENFKKETNNF